MTTKAIALDFDGVILESAAIKTEAMRVLFAGHAAHSAEIAALHERHAGISRYVKFDMIHRDILKTPLAPAAREALGRKFSDLVVAKVLACSFVPGAREFLEARHRSLPLFVISGTPDGELAEIVARRGLASYFKGVYGSPRSKAEILRSIFADHGLEGCELIFVGDGLSDFEAARAVGVPFVGRVRDGEASPFPATTAVVSNLTELESMLDRIRPLSMEPRS